MGDLKVLIAAIFYSKLLHMSLTFYFDRLDMRALVPGCSCYTCRQGLKGLAQNYCVFHVPITLGLGLYVEIY